MIDCPGAVAKPLARPTGSVALGTFHCAAQPRADSFVFRNAARREEGRVRDIASRLFLGESGRPKVGLANGARLGSLKLVPMSAPPNQFSQDLPEAEYGPGAPVVVL